MALTPRASNSLAAIEKLNISKATVDLSMCYGIKVKLSICSIWVSVKYLFDPLCFSDKKIL